MMVRKAGLCAAALSFALPVQAAPAPPAALPVDDMTAYVVQPRDTLFALARRYMVSLAALTPVRQVNNIANPRRLRPGTTLAIPSALLRAQPLAAQVEAVSGIANLKDSAGLPARALVKGADVAEGAILQTQANSFVTLRFTDGSRVSLPSNSIVRMLSARRITLDDANHRRFEVVSGRIGFEVTPATNRGDRFEVRTPMAVSAVRGTEFRVGFLAERQISTLEVLDGSVAESGIDRAASVAVGAGFAARRAEGAAASTLVALLPAPDLANPGRVQSDPEAMFAIDRPKPNHAYRFLLARDSGFIDSFAETTASDGKASFGEVPNGTFFVRATAIDENGIEGRPVNYSFDRQRSGLAASASAPAANGPKQYVFKWQGSGEGQLTYRFVLARNAGMTDAIVDEAGLTANGLSLTALTPGTYYWQVSMVQSVGGKSYRRSLPVNELRIAPPQ
jgi:hypothetical protein